jgi:hypothetical protein
MQQSACKCCDEHTLPAGDHGISKVRMKPQSLMRYLRNPRMTDRAAG